MNSLYCYLIVVRECGHQWAKLKASTQKVAEITMMDSLVNLRLNGIIIVVELQTFVCVAINLLLITMVMLLTALLVGVIVVRSLQCLHGFVFMVVSHSHKMYFIAIQRKKKADLDGNDGKHTLAHYGI